MAKSGNLLATDYVLSALGFNVKNGWNGANPFGNHIWGAVETSNNAITFSEKKNINKQLVPDVHNMGARDAIYLLESCGIKVVMSGRGRVVEQSLAPGDKIKRGMVCKLRFV